SVARLTWKARKVSSLDSLSNFQQSKRGKLNMPNVLLVDDEPSIRLTMGEFLKRAGYSVVIAADYDSAVTQKAEDLDVAVIDVNLPGKSGIQLLQTLCNAKIYVPVIMITGE